MQHVAYELDVDDMVAFAKHHMRHDREYASAISKTRWIWFIEMALLGGVAKLLEEPTFAVVCGVLAGYFLLFYPRSARKDFVKAHSDHFQTLNKAYLGRQELTLENDQLHSKSNACYATIKVSILERLEETPTYVFIYQTPNQAIVIPKQRILSGNVEWLASELGQAIPMKSL